MWVLIVALGSAPVASLADDSDPAAAYAALRAGEILTLSTVLQIVEPITKGKILEVEIENADTVMAYEIFYLDQDGSRHVIYVGARSGEVLAGKPRPAKP